MYMDLLSNYEFMIVNSPLSLAKGDNCGDSNAKSYSGSKIKFWHRATV